MDNIDKVCYIIKNGASEKLANYDEKYVPPAPSIGAYLPRWKVILCGSLLALLIAILVSRQYRKCRRLA